MPRQCNYTMDSIYGISHDHNDGEDTENALWFTQSTVYIVLCSARYPPHSTAHLLL